MKANLRKTIVAGSITALIAFPVWAASDASKERSNTPTNSASQPAQQQQSQQQMGQGTGANSQSSGAAAPAGASASASNPLHARTADDLEDMEIVNAAGDTIASIDGVVMTPDRSEAHAVIKVGGVMGVGGREVLASLDELVPVGDDKLRIDATEEALKARPEFNDDQYVEIEGDSLIGDSLARAGGGASQGGMGGPRM